MRIKLIKVAEWDQVESRQWRTEAFKVLLPSARRHGRQGAPMKATLKCHDAIAFRSPRRK
jgi:hypothetical protein